jgi:prophage regulatory protein
MQTAADKVLKLADVIALTGIRRSTLFKLAANGTFPRQFPLSPGSRSVGWLASEVQEFVRAQVAASRAVTQ